MRDWTGVRWRKDGKGVREGWEVNRCWGGRRNAGWWWVCWWRKNIMSACDISSLDISLLDFFCYALKLHYWLHNCDWIDVHYFWLHYCIIIRGHFVWLHSGAVVRVVHSQKVFLLECLPLGSFCVEFMCSPCACKGFLHVLQFSPTE